MRGDQKSVERVSIVWLKVFPPDHIESGLVVVMGVSEVCLKTMLDDLDSVNVLLDLVP
jgi:hypothetical protein